MLRLHLKFQVLPYDILADLLLLLLCTTFKVLIEFVTILFLFYVLVFLHQNAFGMWASQVAQW